MKKIFFLSIIALSFVALSSSALAAPKEPTAEQKQCVKNAIQARDERVSVLYTNFSQTVGAAFSRRTDELKNAYDATTASLRNIAIKNALKNYRDVRADARKKYNDEKKAAWKTYKDEVKNHCSTPTVRITAPDTVLESQDSL